MIDINPETQKTRRERMVTVIAVGASTFAHLFFLLGGIQFYQWSEEEKERERLMVISRIQQQEPEPPPDSPRPSPARQRAVPDASLPKKALDSPAEQESRAEKDLGEIAETVEEIPEPEEVEETVISVVTDLVSASFTIDGPAEFFGSGKFWMKKGAPPGEYTATFHPVQGYRTPPMDTKTLVEEAMVAFVGRYTRSVEVKVQTPGTEGATFKIIAPDGSTLDMKRTGRTFFEDLKPGSYTIVYNDVPGFITPSSSTSILGRGGNLSFTGRYRAGGGGGDGDGDGRGGGFRREALGLDRRVKMVVKSYPETANTGGFPPIVYPEVVIKRGDFQKGWCQVYLVLAVDDSGGIRKVRVERPKRSERPRFQTLISTVEQAVMGWEYDSVEAQVHVDVRFYVE